MSAKGGICAFHLEWRNLALNKFTQIAQVNKFQLNMNRMFGYEEITRVAAEQIKMHIQAARRANPLEARDNRERAYGAYLGWRSLVGARVDQAQFHADDLTLEALLLGSSLPLRG